MSDFPRIPGLDFVSLLGQGGMAAVYVARQLSLGREVAVKLVRPQGESGPAQLQRLENEARSLAGLQHPHIVELYDFGRTDDGAMYYVMPLLPGGDLRRWSTPADEDRVAALLGALLEALGQAHDAGIVHRDIKPENILFDRNDRPLLADFGAALRRDRTRLTEEGLAIGSTGYMSPEQARGMEVDARSDLYSIGVLAFELLTGRLPFDGPDAFSIALAQLEHPVPAVPDHLAHWQDFFDRALAVSPEHRFADARAMREALDGLDAEIGAPVARRMPPPWWRAALTVGVGSLVSLALLFWLVGDPRTDADRAAALIDAGQWLPPDEPNALEVLLEAAQQGGNPEALATQQSRLLEALLDAQQSAIRAADLDALLPHWRRWQMAVGALGAQADPRVVEHNQEVELLLILVMDMALAEQDRAIADTALQMVDASTLASKSLLEKAATVARLALVGERFADEGGPPLVLVRRPGSALPGLAVMPEGVSATLFAEFESQRGRTPRDCAAPLSDVRGCMDIATARQLARWLSGRTGAVYRLAERSELAALLSHLTPAPLVAWTSTCNTVRIVTEPNAAQRTLGGVRRLFGGEGAKARTEQRCDGYWTLALDGSATARARSGAPTEATAVLVREIERLQ